MLGVAGVLSAIVRMTLRSDELRRQVVINASAIAFGATLFITMTLGFLENAGIARLNWAFVWPIGLFSWVAAVAILNRWYR